ncbi:MAG: hypothetical protein M1818_005920 [Claussenomyces sp. TS43310]|nr:MAG: hypothetical protein M1818_005920 [Claussenomyces sp. TS43310]
MPTLEEMFQTACDALEIPGAVVVASVATGRFEYRKAFGRSSLKDLASAKPLELDATFVLASCTKLMATIAALQCVERGQLSLDEDVSIILPELKDIEVLTGFQEGTGRPILKKAEKKITLRQLLTHTSGIGYDMMDPSLRAWRTYRNESLSWDGMPLLQRILVPLKFEPGTSWLYGFGIDWAGEMVTRANGGMTLQTYMEKNLWAALGIEDMTFHWEQHPSMLERRVAMSRRSGPVDDWGLTVNPSGKVYYTDEEIYPHPVMDEYGGTGALASAPEYLKILRSVLANDRQLLRPATVDEMFKPQLGREAKQAFAAALSIPQMNNTFWGGPLGVRTDWGLGGMLVLEDLPTGRTKGSLSWSGLPNCHWWIDREAGLCGMYASQLLPYGDPKSAAMHQMFEKDMYERLRRSRL